jgi:hypothetical protein
MSNLFLLVTTSQSADRLDHDPQNSIAETPQLVILAAAPHPRFPPRTRRHSLFRPSERARCYFSATFRNKLTCGDVPYFEHRQADRGSAHEGIQTSVPEVNLSLLA